MSPDRGWHLETLHSAFLHFPPFSPRATCFTGLDPLEAPPLQNKAGHCLLPFNRGGSTMHSARRNWGESQSSPRIHHTRRGRGAELGFNMCAWGCICLVCYMHCATRVTFPRRSLPAPRRINPWWQGGSGGDTWAPETSSQNAYIQMIHMYNTYIYLRHLRRILDVSWARCTCAGNVAADGMLARVSELFVLELAMQIFFISGDVFRFMRNDKHIIRIENLEMMLIFTKAGKNICGVCFSRSGIFWSITLFVALFYLILVLYDPL